MTRKKYQFHDTELSAHVQHAYHALAIDERRAPFEPTLWQYKPKADQTVEQVWFCGAHSDVGGGYETSGLSDIALEWMLEKARGAGLELDAQASASYTLAPDPLAERHNSKKGLYRLTVGIDRRIGLSPKDRSPDPTQSIHPSVLTRWDSDEKYRPPALAEYFARTNNPRARTSTERSRVAAQPAGH